MGDFFAELKRRHVYRVGAAYAVVAWVLLQLFNNVAPILEAPPWVARVFLLILILGFPIALLLAWTFEATLAGIKRETPAVDGAPPPLRHSRIDWVLAGALIVVIALVSYQQLAPRSGTSATQQATVVGAAGPPAQGGGISIAVLPFANLSGDASQEFFSDGITEEITAALARVKSLRMVGRSSAFQFKGQNRDLRAIGQTLNANYLIDGSVRREGDRVRITAQLVQADNGVSLWTESYDRQLTSVFATQEDIAQAIAGALRVPLGLSQGESLVAFRTDDLESYQQYLRARARLRAFDAAEAVAILERVVARDPEFAPAWALLARAYSSVRGFDTGARAGPLDEQQRRFRQSLLDREEHAAREAIRLDPRHAGGYAALGSVQMFRGKNWTASEDLYRQSLALDPNDPDTLLAYALTLNARGYLRQASGTAEQLRALEPSVPAFSLLTAYFLYLDGQAGQAAAAASMLQEVPSGGFLGYVRNMMLATAYATVGRYSEAADTLLALPPESPVSRASIEEAARLLRSAPMTASNPDTLPALEGELRFVYAVVGAHDRAFDYAERSVELGAVGGTGMRGLWEPLYAPLRKTERFKTLMRNTGLVDYWRARGWPDLCRPVGADDFECV